MDTLITLVVAVTLASTAYSALAACLALRFRRRPPPSPAAPLPPVSILKPVRGAEPGFYENIASHARQRYPEFELIFAAADAEDPALDEVRRLAREFPGPRIETLVRGPSDGGNPKVALLKKAVAAARYDLMLVSDADVRVSENWLRGMVGALAAPNVGLVTCLYRARPGRTLASRLDALWISADFAGQVLVAETLVGIRFALGAAMLFRRRDLNRIGGFEAIRPYLADDYQLGSRIAGLGLRVALGPEPVEVVLGDESAGQVARRHLRWLRTIRVSRPGGHAALFVVYTGFWSLLALALAPMSGPAPAAIGLAGLFVGLFRGWASGMHALRGGFSGMRIASAPLVDVWSFLLWAASFLPGPVWWRGKAYRLDRQGRMRPAAGRRRGPAGM